VHQQVVVGTLGAAPYGMVRTQLEYALGLCVAQLCHMATPWSKFSQPSARCGDWFLVLTIRAKIEQSTYRRNQ
jgi:hypothetical protein